mmetsp:Transcript_58102/g.127352  ORF Transcript_58102/g.127352 Transcript_58102/m.127352 type:complete len:202 (-) Transcript_58102:892-1497(-)
MLHGSKSPAGGLLWLALAAGDVVVSGKLTSSAGNAGNSSTPNTGGGGTAFTLHEGFGAASGDRAPANCSPGDLPMLGRLGELALDPLLTGRSEARGFDNKEPVVEASSLSCFLELQGRFGDITAASEGRRKLGGGAGASGHAAAGFFGLPASSTSLPATRCRRAITAAADRASNARTEATIPPAPPPLSSATSTSDPLASR